MLTDKNQLKDTKKLIEKHYVHQEIKKEIHQ
jgi:hypothetical protein